MKMMSSTENPPSQKDLEAVKAHLQGERLKEMMQRIDDSDLYWTKSPAETKKVKNLIIASGTPIESKLSLISFLTQERDKASPKEFTRDRSANIKSLLPTKLRKNLTFQDIFTELLNIRKGNTGKGEMLISMIFSDVKGPSGPGDLIIGGRIIEIKGDGGFIYGKGDEEVGDVVKLKKINKWIVEHAIKNKMPTDWYEGVKKIKSNPEQFRLFSGGSQKTKGGDFLWRYLTNDVPGAKYDLKTTEIRYVLIEYLKALFFGIKVKEATSFANELMPVLGDAKKVQKVSDKHFVPFQMQRFKDVKGWDSLILISPTSGNYACFVDPTKAPMILKNTSLGKMKLKTPMTAMGKSAQGAGPGLMHIVIK